MFHKQIIQTNIPNRIYTKINNKKVKQLNVQPIGIKCTFPDFFPAHPGNLHNEPEGGGGEFVCTRIRF